MSYIFSSTKIAFALSSFVFLMCCLNPAHANTQKSIHARQQSKPYVDLGVDTATVKTQTVLLSDPSITSTKIGVLRPGDLTVLVSRDIWNGWLRVIQYSSGRQGWVLVNRLLTPEYTKHRKPSMVLTGTALGTDVPPVIEVDNQSDVQLYLHVDKLAEMSVNPHSIKSFTVQAGLFPFNAAGANVLPDFGYIAFLNGTKYPWRFFTRPHHQHKQQTLVTSEIITKYNALSADVKAKRQEAAIEKKQVDDARIALDSQDDKVKSEFSDIETKRTSLDHSDDKAVNAFNNFVDTANSDLETDKGMKEAFNAKVDAYNSLISSLDVEQKQLDDLEESVNAPH